MGYAERNNINSKWNKDRVGMITTPDKAAIASPISNAQSVMKAPTPVKRDEPIVMELTLKSVWGYLCHLFSPSRPTSPAQTS